MAAVVSNPHENDLNWFLKKNRLNVSGDLASSKSEISLRKMRIDENSSASENKINTNTLGTLVRRKSIIGVNPTQK
jgi:hypothetical protein